MAERRLILLVLALLAVSGLYLGWRLRGPVDVILTLRGTRLAALLLVGASVGAATVLFQTTIGNRLLTPGIVGFDALFILIQTALVLVLGGVGHTSLPAVPKFLIEAGCLAGLGMALVGAALRLDAQDMNRMVLSGVILGVLMRGLTSFMQRILDPSEFAIAQASSFVSFNAVDPRQLAIAAPVFALCLTWCLWRARALDVAALGRVQARVLGLDHDRLARSALGIVAIMVAVSTALAGPVTFLGLLAASLASALLPGWRHGLMIPAAAALGALILVAGQFLFERLLGLQSNLAVVVEFAGGILFLTLVLKRRSR